MPEDRKLKIIHSSLKYLLKTLDNKITDAGYNDGVFWYEI